VAVKIASACPGPLPGMSGATHRVPTLRKQVAALGECLRELAADLRDYPGLV
jgi:hypothetical protein